MRFPVRSLLVVATAALVTLAVPMPANAALIASTTTEEDDGQGNGVRGDCHFGLGVLTDSDQMTISFNTYASPNPNVSAEDEFRPKVPVATGVQCRITDGVMDYGSAGSTLVGPAAARTATARMPRLTNPILGCVTAFTAYHDGTLIVAEERCVELR